MKQKFINTYTEFLNENLDIKKIETKKLLNQILKIFKETTEYRSDTYPNIRYAFAIDTPSANSVWFRTKYFGNWKDNVQVAICGGDDFYRIYVGDTMPVKSKDVDALVSILKSLHEEKIERYKNYLTNEYSDNLTIHNALVDIAFLK